jgi:hypothetical protein
MASQTIMNWLLTWADGDEPGAGSQSADSTGLNGQWWKIAEVLAGIFSLPSGALKASIIHGSNLNNDVVDMTSLTRDGSGAICINTGGVNHLMLGQITDDSTIQKNGSTGMLEVKSVPQAKMAANSVGTAELIDANVTTAKIADANVTTAKLEYKEYVAVLSQTGTNAPTVTLLRNTLGVTMTPGRDATGQYHLTGTSAFPNPALVMCMIGLGGTVGFVQSWISTVNIITIKTYNTAGTQADDILNVSTCYIRVYAS